MEELERSRSPATVVTGSEKAMALAAVLVPFAQIMVPSVACALSAASMIDSICPLFAIVINSSKSIRTAARYVLLYMGIGFIEALDMWDYNGLHNGKKKLFEKM